MTFFKPLVVQLPKGHLIDRLGQWRYGQMLYSSHDVIVGGSIERYGEWCQGEMDLLGDFLSAGCTVLDIGAFIGTHTLFCAAVVGSSGHVFAFEPQVPVFYALCGNVIINGLSNVSCKNVAVGRVVGQTHMPMVDYTHSNNFGCFALENDEECATSPCTVPMVTVDSLGLSTCDLIKVDVEGSELNVLHGAINTVKTLQPLLYVENNSQKGSDEILNEIIACGYHPYWHVLSKFNENNWFHNDDHSLFRELPYEVNVFCVPPHRHDILRRIADLASHRESDDDVRHALACVGERHYRLLVAARPGDAERFGKILRSVPLLNPDENLNSVART